MEILLNRRLPASDIPHISIAEFGMNNNKGDAMKLQLYRRNKMAFGVYWLLLVVCILSAGVLHAAAAMADTPPVNLNVDEANMANPKQVAKTCNDLSNILTVYEMISNIDSHPLAANQIGIYLKEDGIAHLHSKIYSVPAIAPGDSVYIKIAVGTDASNRANIPGMHALIPHLTSNGKDLTGYGGYGMLVTFPKGFCQLKPVKSLLPSQMHLKADRHAHAISIPPKLRVIQRNDKIDYRCVNLQKLDIIQVTLYNDGGKLATGHAKIYAQEINGTGHIAAPFMPVPAMPFHGSAQVTLTAGTQEAYLAHMPGVHNLALYIVVDGKSAVFYDRIDLGPHACQRQLRIKSPSQMQLKAKPTVKQFRLPAR